MDSGTLALWGVCILWALLAFWCWISYKYMENASKIHNLLRDLHAMDRDKMENLESRLDATQALYDSQLRRLEQRVAGVEALLVSTVGQETEDFCRAMDALMDKMDAQKEELEPAPKGKEKLTLSEQYCGAFKPPKPDKWRGGKKGAGRG